MVLSGLTSLLGVMRGRWGRSRSASKSGLAGLRLWFLRSAWTFSWERGWEVPFFTFLQLLVPMFLGEARAVLKWADGKMIKHEVDMQVGTFLS